ncbi:tetratricopeptide repeat protein [bacterium]|nr:tetratricopeptide repeat protein [bacterium]
MNIPKILRSGLLLQIPLIVSLMGMGSCTTSMDQKRNSESSTKADKLGQRKIEGGKVDAEVLKARPDMSAQATHQESYRNVSDQKPEYDVFQSAQSAQSAGDERKAEALYAQYVKLAPEGQYVDRVSMRLAVQAYERHDYAGSKAHYRRVADLSPPSRLRAQAQFGVAQSEFAMGQSEDALKSLSAISFKELPPNLKGQVFAFWSLAAAQAGKWLESTLASIKAYWEAKGMNEQQTQAAFIREQIDRRLVETELQFVLKEYPQRFPSNEVRLRLATLYLARGEKDEAEIHLTTILSSSVAGSEIWEKAKSLQGRAGQMTQVASYRIGALLPLSGNREKYGRAVIDGLNMALGGQLANGQKIELVLADVGPNKGTLKAAFERLVFEDRVMAVIGPINGANSDFVAQWSVEYGVPNIALSSKPDLPEKGNFVFRSAVTPAKQAHALVRFSRERLKADEFAVLFPEDSFGETYAKAYVDSVRMQGGILSAAESYPPKTTDFKVPIQNMIGKGHPYMRSEEFKMMVEKKETELGRDLTPKEKRELETPPIVDFDVLFIPDTYRPLGQIVPALLYADVKTPVLIGPATWKNPNLLRRAGQYLDGSLFVDSWSSERQSSVTKDFVEQFQVRNGSMPNSLNALGYDVGLALNMAYKKSSMPPSSRDELRSRLEYLGEVPGAMGLHIWDASRDTLSELQLYKTQRGAFVYQGSIRLN